MCLAAWCPNKWSQFCKKKKIKNLMPSHQIRISYFPPGLWKEELVLMVSVNVKMKLSSKFYIHIWEYACLYALGISMRPGARFTNDFLPAIQIRWKLPLAVIPLLAIRSQQIFAHATTAQLSCHVQNFVAITVLESRWVKRNFHRIWIAMEKPLVKRGPDQNIMTWVMKFLGIALQNTITVCWAISNQKLSRVDLLSVSWTWESILQPMRTLELSW